MNSKHLKTLHSIIESFELNEIILSNIIQVLEKEKASIEARRNKYESKYTDYWTDKADELTSTIDTLEDEIDALEEIITSLQETIELTKEKIVEIEDVTNSPLNIAPLSHKNSDELFDECARLIVSTDIASTSSLQRRYSIGYNRANKIMEQLEESGIVSAPLEDNIRRVLVDSITLERILAGR